MFFPDDSDDPEFIELAGQVVRGAVLTHTVSSLRVDKIDNWFDHKWLGFSRAKVPRVGKRPDGLLHGHGTPSFVPNRVVARWCYEIEEGQLSQLDPDFPYWTCEAVVFVSGKSTQSGRGSLMVYFPAGLEALWPWYVGFARDATWNIVSTKGISRRELDRFCDRGK